MDGCFTLKAINTAVSISRWQATASNGPPTIRAAPPPCCSRWEASEGTMQCACLAVLPPCCVPLLGTCFSPELYNSRLLQTDFIACALLWLFDLPTGIAPFFTLSPILSVEWDALNAVIPNARLSHKWSFWTAEPQWGDDFQREGMHPNESAPSGAAGGELPANRNASLRVA